MQGPIYRQCLQGKSSIFRRRARYFSDIFGGFCVKVTFLLLFLPQFRRVRSLILAIHARNTKKKRTTMLGQTQTVQLMMKWTKLLEDGVIDVETFTGSQTASLPQHPAATRCRHRRRRRRPPRRRRRRRRRLLPMLPLPTMSPWGPVPSPSAPRQRSSASTRTTTTRTRSPSSRRRPRPTV